MATLATCFQDALSTIEPDEDKKNAAKAHAEVRDVLSAKQELKDLGISPVLIGSYARHVSIRHVKDVDVFARLENADDSLAPGAALDAFEEVLVDEYTEDRVERQFRSIKVDFPEFDLTVDAVPARPCGDNWEIPNKPEDAQRAQWVETNPLKLNELTEEVNGKFLLNGNGIYVPIVKLVRQVRRTWLDDQPGGLFFELMSYWYFQNDQPSATSVAEYLTMTLEGIATMLPTVASDGLDDPTLPGEKISTKADDKDLETAQEKFREAADLAAAALADDDPCTSAVKWRELLGKTSDCEDIFPLPSYCNDDGTRKKAAAITSGATTVPAGDDRYA
ncbi:nucleotidyltransferase domain-containing protein [Mycobacteroides abscessus]|uniref:nucleotidyltransferase domain-containing protein n=1 Tax=Mycobacteroides abscessus TaxID=36809 RepID=UPI00266D8832|nr:nucleotidyltransferase [Mycobacteroides abscessus]MDO3175905.1 nucleotidyltransferase [Mycobacteroides abscessus subsp. abscessus]